MSRHVSGREGVCRRGCCWTPFDVCGHQGACQCHWSPTTKQHVADEAAKQAEIRRQKYLASEWLYKYRDSA